MELKCIRSPRDLSLRKLIKCLVGNLGLALFPQSGRRVEQDPYAQKLNRFDRMLRNGLLYRALRSGDHEKLANYLKDYWSGSEGKEFHEEYSFRFQEVFLQHHIRAVEAFENIASSTKLDINRLYEIGCGSGQVLDHLSKRLSGIEEFVGIDLSEEQINEIRETYKGSPSMRFVAADAATWLAENAEPGAVVFTNGGVFELFNQRTLQKLFAHIASSLKPAAIVAIETFGNDHDLQTELDTIAFGGGGEIGFSHNYPHLLREAGFRIAFQEERIAEDQNRWILIVAVAEGS